MKRRAFLKTGLAGAGAGVSATVLGCTTAGESPAVVGARPNVQWRLASSFPQSLDTIYGSGEVLAERVEALTGGRFRIRVHQAGEVVPALQVLDAVQQGTVQAGQSASYYFLGKNPALAFDTCVPFGMNARQQAAWLHEGGGLDLTRELFADFNVINFPAGNTGTQMGGWFKREIQTADDLAGLKMRIPGLGGEVMSRLGATVQVLAGGDIFPALERGAIDATEWVGPYDDEKLGFYKVAKNYYYPGWWEPGPSLSFFVNRAAWDKLPVEYQEAFASAARHAEVAMQTRYDAQNPGALERLVEKGVRLIPFSAEIMNAARETAFDLYEEQASKDPAYRKVYSAWSGARRTYYRWFGTAELAFSSYAFGGE